MSVGLGTHLSFLIHAVENSEGPIAEIGAGFYSTPYLHYKAQQMGRELFTFENDKKFLSAFDRYKSDTHHIIPVDNWDDIDLESKHWGVALIDHAPADRRIEEIRRLANNCDFIVIHDTEGRREHYYHYSETLKTFKNRKDFTRERPHTTVVSNLKDVWNFPS